jgi:hypothetical protein
MLQFAAVEIDVELFIGYGIPRSISALTTVVLAGLTGRFPWLITLVTEGMRPAILIPA